MIGSFRAELSSLLTASSEAKELCWDGRVPELSECPDAFTFCRNWLMPNKPFVVRGGCADFPAISKWSFDYLRTALAKRLLSVAVTPNGYADAVFAERFTLPEERQMTMSDFLAFLAAGKEHEIAYMQKQNSSLTLEFQPLAGDVPAEIGFASAALGRPPDAVNFWLGDGRAVTSLHKDPYENIYCVVSGTKFFTLIPPTDAPCIPYRSLPVYRWSRKPGQGEQRVSWDLVPEAGLDPVPWATVDPLNFDSSSLFADAHMLQVELHAGDMLYLPALWFHHVRQSHGCLAVNYWYDMDYDIKYAYFKMLERFCVDAGLWQF